MSRLILMSLIAALILPTAVAVAGPAAAEVKSTVQSHQAEVRQCYEHALTKAETLEGRVVLEFVINAQGRVEAASIASSSWTNEGADACLVSAASGWEFEPSEGAPLQVRYPFVFSLGE